jgi:phosphoadenosine phosphosulfate reductase
MEQSLKDQLPVLTDLAGNTTIEDFIMNLTRRFGGKVTFSTSFSFEDQVITEKIAAHQLPVKIFTLDTGRLFAETYSVWRSTLERYQIPIHAFYPEQGALEEFVTQKGPNSFYESVENRKQCCFIRKVAPLKRALSGYSVWITGLRAEHSTDRNEMPQLEWDPGNQIIKYHPLLHWTTGEVKAYINEKNIPYNPLHDKGYVSIGCLPCTRAIQPGEDFRAGRWWWEDNNKKECGLHLHEQAS